MVIKDKFRHVFGKPEDDLLTIPEIKERIWAFDRKHELKNTNEKSIIPSDYCYNRVNLGSSGVHIFELSDKHEYKCLGIGYPYTGNIFHLTKHDNKLICVGRWTNGLKEFFNDPHFDFIQDEDDENVFIEGRERFELHKRKERNHEISILKKGKILKNTGKLSCEVCGFDFYQIYGDRGYGFIECHHNNPISELTEASPITLENLSLLCSNCHRMIHRAKPWISVNELKNIVKASAEKLA
jgi:5-methylcytosine-specific restriction endonuclease McrA